MQGPIQPFLIIQFLERYLGTARPRLVRMTGPEKNRTNQKRTIYLLKPKITLKSAKTRAK